MTSIGDLSSKCFGGNKEKITQIGDVLKFYHDIGVLLYFNDNNMSETVIIDIQWFIDSFKNIITDPNHARDIVENYTDWWNFYESGHILDRLLTDIWSTRRFEVSFWDRHQEKTNLLQYMQRLGLIAVGADAHYIPCMNKRAFGIEEENYFRSLHSKTSVLVFKFQFLPFFFYYRLIVACLTRTNREWRVLKDNGLCLYKNVACFDYRQHVVALAVNNSSIQLQIFQPTNVLVMKEVALKVRNTVESLLKDLLGNFHKKIDIYTVGYQCCKQEVFREHDDCFLEEKDICRKGKITCPMHGMINHHVICESSLLVYWKLDVIADISDLDDFLEQDECTNLSESELSNVNFKTFEKLTKIGRDALQLYFDRIFPPVDLVTTLTLNKDSLQRGQKFGKLVQSAKKGSEKESAQNDEVSNKELKELFSDLIQKLESSMNERLTALDKKVEETLIVIKEEITDMKTALQNQDDRLTDLEKLKHRGLPKNPNSSYKPEAPEAVIVKFVLMEDRNMILNHARNTTLPKGYAIRTDLPVHLKRKRAELAQKAYRTQEIRNEDENP
ncbi:uncharacterized protein LOC134237944 [Saccostrea cucullata]|uniref:uncharacterized protein LOC134237944 n=1 Tax=Saccostrea cuccullata TaxID=36930 RepID=UPI002ED65B8A